VLVCGMRQYPGSTSVTVIPARAEAGVSHQASMATFEN